MSDYKLVLEHHGILGQKWGVRRFQNKDGTRTDAGKKRNRAKTRFNQKNGESGSEFANTTRYYDKQKTLKKGSTVYRLSNNRYPKSEDFTYVSLNRSDNKRWNKYFKATDSRPGDLYLLKYKTTKDIKIAPETEVGRRYVKSYIKQYGSDNVDSFIKAENREVAYDMKRYYGVKAKPSSSLTGSVEISHRTEIGRRIVDDLFDSGYGGIPDTKGTNVAKNPMIIIDPKNNLRLKSVKKV